MGRLLLAAAAGTLVLCGCAGTTAPPPSGGANEGNASAIPSATMAATPTVAMSPEPVSTDTFESDLYPYSLTLPPGVATRRWHAATEAWDGVSRFASEHRDPPLGSPYIDDTGTPDGGLFILGTPTSDTLEAFAERVADNQSRFHGCSAPAALQPVEVVGEPGLSFIQLCADGTVAVRVVTIHAGFGFAANIQSDRMPPAKQPVVAADLLAWLGGLVWR